MNMHFSFATFVYTGLTITSIRGNDFDTRGAAEFKVLAEKMN